MTYSRHTDFEQLSKEELIALVKEGYEREHYAQHRQLQYSQRIGKVGSWELNLVDNSFFASEELYHILEAYPKQLPNADALFHQIDVESQKNLVKQDIDLFSHEKHAPVELIMHTFKDNIKNVLCIGNFVAAESQVIVGFVQDISLKRSWERKIHHTQTRLKTLQRIAHIGSFEYYFRDKRVLWSDYMYELLGVEPTTQLYESSLMSLVHPEDQERVIRNLNKKSQERKAYHEDFRMLRKDGNTIDVTATIHTQFDTYGKPLKSIGVIQDITERKKAEQKVQEQNEQLKVLNRQLDQFVYSVSHDLRAPLTSAKGLLEILQSETEEQQRIEYYELMHKSLDRLDNFIQDIVQLSRNSRLEVAIEPIDFLVLFQDIIESHRFSEEAEDVHIATNVEQNTTFFSDRKRLSVVISNLFSNALRYKKPYQEAPWVELSAKLAGKTATIEVKDNGQGIAEVHKERIFEMFYRANQHKSGSGLGLFIVKETLEKLNGTIVVESVYGKGTKFTIQIPSFAPRDS